MKTCFYLDTVVPQVAYRKGDNAVKMLRRAKKFERQGWVKAINLGENDDTEIRL